MPVRRLAKEVNSVYRNIRYSVMCGESGRGGIRLVARRRTAALPVACVFPLKLQKSKQRPFCSQSPNLVGSGPDGPPISGTLGWAEVAAGTGSGLAAGRTGGGDDSAFFSARFGILPLCQNPPPGTTGNPWKNNSRQPVALAMSRGRQAVKPRFLRPATELMCEKRP